MVEGPDKEATTHRDRPEVLIKQIWSLIVERPPPDQRNDDLTQREAKPRCAKADPPDEDPVSASAS